MLTMVILEPISSGLGLLNAAKVMGLSCVVLTANNGDRALPKNLEHSCHIESVDTYNVDDIEHTIKNLPAKHKLIGIVPGFEYFVPIAAEVAQRLKLPGLDPKDVYALREKKSMKTALAKSDIRITKWKETSLKELSQITKEKKDIGLEFPIVAKPNNLSGSMGVRRIDNYTQLENYFNDMNNMDVIDLDLTPDTFLIEEYIEGPELSVEGFVRKDGRIKIVSLTEKILGAEPNFVELGHIVSKENFSNDRDSIIKYTESVVKALKIDKGPFHAEMRISENGPILIEIGARLPGDHICDVIRYSTGIDLPKVMISSYGSKLDIQEESTTTTKTHGIFFFAGEEGSIVPQIDIEKLKQKYPSIVEFHMDITPGSKISSSGDFLSRFANVIISGESSSEIKKIAASIQTELKA